MKKLQPFVALLFSAVLLLSVVAFAHPGRTDSNGGHSDGSSYHYHHGYPPHQHINGCPYDFDDQTKHGSSASYKETVVTSKQSINSDSDHHSAYLGITIFLVICILCSMPFFGISTTLKFVLGILQIPLILLGVFSVCLLHAVILPVCWALQIFEFISRHFAKIFKLINLKKVVSIMEKIVVGLIVVAVIVCFATLLPVESEGFVCDGCGDYNEKLGSVVEVYISDVGYYYCSDCLSGDMYRCLNCGKYEDIGSGYVIKTGLCDDCSGQAYVPCFECGYEFPQNTVIHYGDLYICIPCIEKVIN